MNRRRSLLQLFVYTLVVLILVGCGAPPATSESEAQVATLTAIPSTATATSIPSTATSTPEPPTATATPVLPTLVSKSPDKILIVGLDLWYQRQLENMAISADTPLINKVDIVQWFGALEDAWKDSDAREQIADGNYDVVVLEENLHHTDEDAFHEYARMFDAEIKEAGAETVLLMAWPVEGSRKELITYEEIFMAHEDVAIALGVEVSPVALAWQRASEERPDLELFELEWEEPSIYGKYLTINVLYATLFGESPVDLAYLPEEFEEISEEEAAYLQRIALETVLEYQD